MNKNQIVATSLAVAVVTNLYEPPYKILAIKKLALFVINLQLLPITRPLFLTDYPNNIITLVSI